MTKTTVDTISHNDHLCSDKSNTHVQRQTSYLDK